jgi:hypothetical protein
MASCLGSRSTIGEILSNARYMLDVDEPERSKTL